MTTNFNEKALFSEVIRARRSVRNFDPTYKMSKQEIEELLAEAVLAPSGGNLQPTRFLIIHDDKSKQLLSEIAFNQEQVKAASATIVILGDLEAYRNAEEIFGSAVDKGYLTPELKEQFIQRYTGMFTSMGKQAIKENIAFDAGLVSMQLMLVAKAKGYDTNPMSGFDKNRLSKEFALEDRYVPMALIPIGKPLKPGHPTTRLPLDKVTVYYQG